MRKKRKKNYRSFQRVLHDTKMEHLLKRERKKLFRDDRRKDKKSINVKKREKFILNERIRRIERRKYKYRNDFLKIPEKEGELRPDLSRICEKRRDRREILFKSKKAGKGVKPNKKRIYTEDSKVRC